MQNQPHPLIRLKQGVTQLSHLDLQNPTHATSVVLLFRLILAVIALIVSAFFPFTTFEKQVSVFPGQAPILAWLQRILVAPWTRYDAEHYQKIVNHGYHFADGTGAFHPFYPLLALPLAQLLGGNEALALLIVSTLATIALLCLFTRYVAETHGPEVAQPAAWLLLCMPPAFILLAPYTESTFLCLVVATFLALKRQRWWLAGLFGGLASLTRQQGLALLLPLAWELFTELRAKKPRFWDIGALFLIPLGYGLFIIYRAFTLGDLTLLTHGQSPAQFLQTLLISPSHAKIITGERIAWPWEPLQAQIALLATKPTYYVAIDFLLGWLGVLILLKAMPIFTNAEKFYVSAIILLTTCYFIGDLNPAIAFPRHILIAFPLFIALARWTKGKVWFWMLLEVGFSFNFYLAGLYIRHGWVP